MKFQDTSMHSSKVSAGIKSVTDGRTNGQAKSNLPHPLFQSWGYKYCGLGLTYRYFDCIFILNIHSKITLHYNMIHVFISRTLNEKSRECHNHKPQPTHGTKRK